MNQSEAYKNKVELKSHIKTGLIPFSIYGKSINYVETDYFYHF